MNVAGHRFSSAAIEEVIASHPNVAECAVVGAADELKGQVPLGVVVMRNDADMNSTELVSELIVLVRERIGAVVSFRKVCVVPKLPKTRSGKILRATIRTLADGGEVVTPPTIDDPSVLTTIRALLRT